MKSSTILACCGALQAMLAALPSVQAQTPLPSLPFNLGDAIRSAEAARRAPLPRATTTPVLPQLVEPQLTIADHETLYVRRFEVDDPSLVGEQALRDLLSPYENHDLTLGDIYAAADAVTTLYRAKGYFVAKAYVPAQDARDGVLRIKIVPGRYGSIAIDNASLVRDDYLRGVVDQALAGSPLIHKDALERAMLLLSDLPGAGMPRVAIGPGQQPETSDFVFGVPEGRPITGYGLADNYGSPYTGRNRVSGSLSWNSPLGYGDRLYAFGIVSEVAKLVNGRAAYAFPLGYDGLRGEISAFRTTYVLGGIFQGLGATGTADAISAAVTYPLERQRDESVYVSANFSQRWLNDEILGVSFADRTIALGTLAVTRDWIAAFDGLPLTTSTTFSYTAGYVNFSDPAQRALNIATIDTVGNFEKINLFLTATLALNESLSLSTYVRAQKSLSGNLDSSEQMSLSGFWGVRSYDEGLSGDSGYLVTPELKFALPAFDHFRHSIGIFTDVGAVWLENGAYTTTQKSYTQINDIGLGYYATYEFSPARFLLFKAEVAHTYGSDSGARIYDRGTKGLFQVGLTF